MKPHVSGLALWIQTTAMLVAIIFVLPDISYAQAPPFLNYFPADTHPVINKIDSAKVSSATEWSGAGFVPDDPTEFGTWYGESKREWSATSSSGNSAVYSGTTIFFIHDISRFGVLGSWSYNTFELSYRGNDLVAWVFADDDALDDSQWLPGSGLFVGPNPSPPPLLIQRTQLDDRGFLVRLNRNPLSEQHWLPVAGYYEPGDPQWIWDDYYGFFGMWGFNNTTFQYGLSNATANVNQIYECAYRNPPGGPDSCEFVVKSGADVTQDEPGPNQEIRNGNELWYKGPEHIAEPPDTPWMPTSVPTLSHIYAPYDSAFTCTFYIVNPESAAQHFTGHIWDTRGWVPMRDTVIDLLPCEILSLNLTGKVPNDSTLIGAHDSVWLQGSRGHDPFVVVEVSGPPNFFFVAPESAVVAVGDTLLCALLCYDRDGRPAKVLPEWSVSDGIGSVFAGTRPVVPDEMKIAGFVAGTLGNGYVKATFGSLRDSTWVSVIAPGIHEKTTSKGQFLHLTQNCPNPFDKKTTIQLALPSMCDVTLAIYNAFGQRVRVLVDREKRNAGNYVVYWDGRDEKGGLLSSGVYFYKLQTNNYTEIKKSVLSR